MKLQSLRSISLLALGLCALSASAGTYSITDLGSLGGNYTYAYAINSSGQIAGSATPASGIKAYRYSGGTMTDLGGLGGYSYGYGINDSGVVVGNAYTTGPNSGVRAVIYSGGSVVDFTGVPSTGMAISNSGMVTGSSLNGAYLYSGGTMHYLGDLKSSSGTTAIGYALNESGTVVGRSQYNGALGPFIRNHAFVSSGGVMTDLGTFGGTDSEAHAINESGTVVGFALTTGNTSQLAFKYSGGVMTALGELKPGAGSSALGINDAGVIVGSSGVTGGLHAVVWNGTTAVDLNNQLSPTVTGWTLQYAYGINNSGQIVGYGSYNGVVRSFLLTPTPVPEPATWAALGFGTLAVLRRRRKA
jgi:probable HAF family extracellular repeat protein